MFLEIILTAIILAISIGLHEYAHAITSFKLGDPTPKLQNRLTPNPLAHIDIVGFLMIFIINFGRGKPVQVDPRYYKNPLRDELFVSLAGPITNFVMALIGIMIIVLLTKIFGEQLYNTYLAYFLYGFVQINIGLAVFNLMPIPPLDGYRIIKFLSPMTGYRMDKNYHYLGMFFLFLILFPITGNMIGSFVGKVVGFIYNFMWYIVLKIFY